MSGMVNRLSIHSLTTTLRQTRDAVVSARKAMPRGAQIAAAGDE
ncbi:MAG TPA: hypothetical protein VKV17_04510 [Bryobacteraceae bacterium]|nr:hypothetical protein [Bryobacteraceae bacterium]